MGRLFPHEWIAGAVALLSCSLLLVIVPTISANQYIVHTLTSRAITNVIGLVRVQAITTILVGTIVIALRRWTFIRPFLVLQTKQGIILTLIRVTIPLLLMIVFHQSIPLWQHDIGTPDADRTLMNLDTSLFWGTNPTLWLQRIISRPLTEFMRAAYLSWFVGFQGTIYVVALARPLRALKDMLLGTVLTLFFGYIGYSFQPSDRFMLWVLCSRLTFRGAVGQLTNTLVDQFGFWRDAFPSIHVAIASLMMIYAWRYIGRLKGVYTITGQCIVFSTIYLRWHYVVDVLAGIGLAIACAWIAPRLLDRWEQFATRPAGRGSNLSA
jgi:membrane-associated phospholipid phosphatase